MQISFTSWEHSVIPSDGKSLIVFTGVFSRFRIAGTELRLEEIAKGPEPTTSCDILASPDSRFVFLQGVAVPFANFGLPALTAKAQYINAKQDALNDAIGAQRSDTDHFSVGVDYAWNATNVASISYYHSDNDKISKDKTEMFVLNHDFSLSKRKVIYIQTAIVDSDEGSTYFTQALLGPKGQLSPVLDKTNVIFGVGISHSF